MIRQNEGSDPAAVLFDACRAAKARGTEVLICDTAGRLHNKKNLMAELAKMNKVVEREMPDVHRETFLVLDATTGQNAVNQARAFSEVANITGIILTKLDGSSKGGIVVSICKELGIPVRLVGVGEGIDDMQPFNAADFAEALFED
jgi:fused signal recognition particle receptor